MAEVEIKKKVEVEVEVEGLNGMLNNFRIRNARAMQNPSEAT